MSDEQNDELGDFEPGPLTGEDDENDEQVERKAQNAVGGANVAETPDEDPRGHDEQDLPDRETVADLREQVERLEPVDEENPIDLDPRIGRKDIAFDRAKPGAKVYVVDVLAESVPDYYEEFPDAPALDDYAGNVLTEFTRDDAVLACVYVKDSLTNVDTNTTAYPMPESRLTRYPAEEASMVGSSSVEFARTHLPGTPEGANRPTGVAVEDAPDRGDEEAAGEPPAAGEMDLSTALACIATHGHTERAEEIREFEGLDEEEVYGL